MGQRMPFPPWLKTVAGEDALEEYDAELAVRRSLWKNERLTLFSVILGQAKQH